MKTIIPKVFPFVITVGVFLLLILYVSGKLPVFVPFARPYLAAGTIPKDPGLMRWEITEIGLFSQEATIHYSTGTKGIDLIRFYTESMRNNGWQRIDEDYTNTNLYEIYTFLYRREYAGKVYYARIPLRIHKSAGDVSDETITISTDSNFGK